jgi:hypothetical protein
MLDVKSIPAGSMPTFTHSTDGVMVRMVAAGYYLTIGA